MKWGRNIKIATARLAAIAVLALPILELWIFIEVGGEIGALSVIAATLATAALGLLALRIQGFTIANRLRAAANGAEPPGRPVLEGLGLGLAAVLLLIPGFLTDALGILMVIPWVRRALVSLLIARLRPKPDATVIEGEFTDVTPSSRPPLPNPRDRLPEREPPA